MDKISKMEWIDIKNEECRRKRLELTAYKVNELVEGYNEIKTQITIMKSSFNVDIENK